MKFLKKIIACEKAQLKNPETQLVIGMVLGLLIGIGMDNIGVGIALGVALGAPGYVSCKKKKDDVVNSASSKVENTKSKK